MPCCAMGLRFDKRHTGSFQTYVPRFINLAAILGLYLEPDYRYMLLSSVPVVLGVYGIGLWHFRRMGKKEGGRGPVRV